MKAILTLVLLFSFSSMACDGGLALNKRLINIPEFSALANDMTEAEFKKMSKDFEVFFGPSIEEEHKSELIVFNSWGSNTVNAYAEQSRGKVMITIYGGLARHKAITRDGFVAVLCHELGHHFGGYPKKNSNRWSSAEGQADYYATMKCLRRYWEKADNLGALNDVEIPAKLKEECALTYKSTEGQVLCQRMGLAGQSVALMIQDLDHDSLVPKFETPDPLVVRAMNYQHPYAQCRLDTYFQGAICPVDESEEFNDHEEEIGACHQKNGDTRGLRPKCWFLSQN